MGVRRQQMLAHIMDGSCSRFLLRETCCNFIFCDNCVADSDKGPDRRAKVTLSSPLDTPQECTTAFPFPPSFCNTFTPQPPSLTGASEIALASVIKDVLRRVGQTGELKKGGGMGGKASMTLYRVPSATERRE